VQEDDLQKSHKFATLDGLRGIAALAVLQFHTHYLFGHSLFPEGYLAVDFFFLLSGFVIAYAYQEKLDGGMSTMSFFKMRIARLYPLYFLGLLIGIAFSVVQMHVGSSQHTARGITVLAVLGAFWIPAVVTFAGFSATSFPLNLPAWSLFYEISVNVGHALFFRRRGFRSIGAVVVVSGLALVFSARRLGSMDCGVNHSQILYAFPRVIFSYFLGGLLFMLWKDGRLNFKIPSLVSALILLVVLAVPVSRPRQVPYDLIVTLLVFPVLIIASISAEPPKRLLKLSQALGTSSYAIYVLHVPIRQFFERSWTHIAGHEAVFDAPWPGIVLLLLIVVFALIADRFYDLPARTYLRQRLLRSDVKQKAKASAA
jgi:peptidoglycan/LPS O-acetylase OafA/YrhL